MSETNRPQRRPILRTQWNSSTTHDAKTNFDSKTQGYDDQIHDLSLTDENDKVLLRNLINELDLENFSDEDASTIRRYKDFLENGDNDIKYDWEEYIKATRELYEKYSIVSDEEKEEKDLPKLTGTGRELDDWRRHLWNKTRRLYPNYRSLGFQKNDNLVEMERRIYYRNCENQGKTPEEMSVYYVHIRQRRVGILNNHGDTFDSRPMTFLLPSNNSERAIELFNEHYEEYAYDIYEGRIEKEPGAAPEVTEYKFSKIEEIRNESPLVYTVRELNAPEISDDRFANILGDENCGVTLIVKKFKKIGNKKFLEEVIKALNPDEDGFVPLQNIRNFCKYKKRSMYALGEDGRILAKYVETQNSSKRQTIMFLFCNSHCYEIVDVQLRKSICQRGNKTAISFRRTAPQATIKVKFDKFTPPIDFKKIEKNTHYHVANLKTIIRDFMRQYPNTRLFIDVDSRSQITAVTINSTKFIKDKQCQVPRELGFTSPLKFHYGTTFKNLKIPENFLPPIVRRLVSKATPIIWSYPLAEEYQEQGTTIDIVKCYSSILESLPFIPFFNLDSTVKEYTGNPIKSHYLYLIRGKVPIDTGSCVYGITLKYLRKHYKVEIIAYVRSVRQENYFNESVAEIYEKYPEHAKFIVNYLIGQLGTQTQTKKQKAFVYSTNQQALKKTFEYALPCTNYRNIKLGKWVYHVAFVDKFCRANFENRHIFKLIIEMARLKVLKKVKYLKDRGCQILSVNTDSITYKGELEYKAKEECERGEWGTEKRGKFRIHCNRKWYSMANPPNFVMKPKEPILFDNCENFDIKPLLNDHLIINEMAGSGKSTIIKAIIRHAKQNNEKIYIAAPTHIAAGLINGKTFHSLVGAGFDQILTIDTLSTARSLSGDRLIIDEAFALNSQALHLINEMKNNFEQIILLGDEHQLPPVNDDYTYDINSLNFTPVKLLHTWRTDKDYVLESRDLGTYKKLKKFVKKWGIRYGTDPPPYKTITFTHKKGREVGELPIALVKKLENNHNVTNVHAIKTQRYYPGEAFTFSINSRRSYSSYYHYLNSLPKLSKKQKELFAQEKQYRRSVDLTDSRGNLRCTIPKVEFDKYFTIQNYMTGHSAQGQTFDNIVIAGISETFVDTKWLHVVFTRTKPENIYLLLTREEMRRFG
jgi:hypothetical protein